MPFRLCNIRNGESSSHFSSESSNDSAEEDVRLPLQRRRFPGLTHRRKARFKYLHVNASAAFRYCICTDRASKYWQMWLLLGRWGSRRIRMSLVLCPQRGHLKTPTFRYLRGTSRFAFSFDFFVFPLKNRITVITVSERWLFEDWCYTHWNAKAFSVSAARISEIACDLPGTASPG